MKRLIETVGFVVLVCLSVSASPTPKQVIASSFGFDAANATECLQQAIDTGARTVVVDAGAGDWCIEPIKLRSDLELVFAAGVKVRAVPGAYKSMGAMMFRGEDLHNVTVRGEGGVSISMLKRDYLDDRNYEWSEWRHMFAFYRSQNIAISNLEFSASGGDGVYINNCKDVRIENVLVADHNRQGISIIGVENLYIGRSRFCCTGGTPPQCGIDFEPNHGGNSCLVNITVEDCSFDGNVSCGICFHIPNLGSTSPPMSVSFRRCRIFGNGEVGFRMFNSWGDPGVGGTVDIEDCVIAGNRNGAVLVAAQPSNSLKIRFRDCILDNRGCEKPAVVFDQGQSAFDFGNVSFEDVRVFSDVPEAFSFVGMTGVGVTNLGGHLDVVLPDGKSQVVRMEDVMAANRPDPEARAFKATTVYNQKLKPVTDASIENPLPVFCRGRQYFLQAAPTPGVRKLKLFCKQIAKNPVKPEVVIHDKAGTIVESFALEKDVTDYELKSTVPDGMYTFTINARANLCGVSSVHPGHGVKVDSRASVALASGRKYYFLVPAKSSQIKMEIYPSRENPLCAKILDQAGNVREELVQVGAGQILTILRNPTAEEETWCLDVTESEAPFSIRMGGDVISVLTDDPRACLSY